MPSMVIDVLAAVLFGIFAIATILGVFALAGKVSNEIIEAFQKNTWVGVALLVVCIVGLVAIVYGVRTAIPYVTDFYHQLAG